VFRNLRKNFPGLNVTLLDQNEVMLSWANLVRYDCIMIQRPYKEWSVPLIQMANRLKIPVWVDYDDNLLEVPRGMAKIYDIYNDETTRKTIAYCIQLADVVTVSTDDLKEYLLPINENIVVVRNAIDLDLTGPKSEKERSGGIGWRGSETHLIDLMVYQEQIRQAFAETKCDWYFLGFDNMFLSGERYKYIKPNDIFIYLNTLHQLNLSCLHTPLADNIFNRCKSNIAAIEGTWAGAVCIVPEWKEWDIPGMLKYNDVSSYLNALMAVANNEVDVEKMNKEAWAFICDELSIDKQNKKRIKILKNL